jgi:hypothetical protein
MDNLKNLVKEFGQDYNYVLFIDGGNLVICSVDGTDPPVHTETEKLESVVHEIHGKGLSVRLVYYVDAAGGYSLPDLEEFHEAQGWDY